MSEERPRVRSDRDVALRAIERRRELESAAQAWDVDDYPRPVPFAAIQVAILDEAAYLSVCECRRHFDDGCVRHDTDCLWAHERAVRADVADDVEDLFIKEPLS